MCQLITIALRAMGKLPEVVKLAKLQQQKAPLDAGLAYDLYKDKRRQVPAHRRAITDISVVVNSVVQFIQ